MFICFVFKKYSHSHFVFPGPVYLFPKQLGIDRVPNDELEGLNYIMYLVGKHLGITDQFNMCRQDVGY